MTYTNEKANLYKDNQNSGNENFAVDIVSPKGLISTNNIESLGIETIGEEKGVSQRLDKSAPEKQIQVKQEIINNNDNGVENVSILGTFGTNGKMIINGEEKQSNTGEILQTGLSIETTDSNKIKVYYTQNENASEDLSNQENGWSEQITDSGKTRKYLITVASMEMSESLGISYQAQIPANLEYNQQNYQGYQTTYTESSTGTVQKVDATAIELKTGNGPVVDGKLSATIGNEQLNTGDEVKKGEILNFKVNISNTGTEDASQASIKINIPTGTALLNWNGQGYDRITDTNKTETFDLKTGEEITKQYKIEILDTAVEKSEISEIAQIQYGEVTKQTNEYKLVVSEKSDLSVYIDDGTSNNFVYSSPKYPKPTDYFVGKMERGYCNNNEAYSEGKYSFDILVNNNSNEDKNNIEITINLPEEFSYSECISFKGNIQKLDDGKLKIDKIKANDFSFFKVNVNISKLEQNSKQVMTSLKATYDEIEYHSNEFETEIKGASDISIKQTTNNENEYLKAGDYVTYTFVIENNNLINTSFSFKDNIPNELKIKEILVNGAKIENTNNTILTAVDIGKGEKRIIQISTIVNRIDGTGNSYKITNDAEITTTQDIVINSNNVSHYITEYNVNSSNGGINNNIDPTNPNNSNNTPSTSNTYNISGIAWLDNDSNGEKGANDKTVNGIKVYLIDTTTNSVAKNSSNEDIVSTTDDSGAYQLSGINKGSYIVAFEYDTNNYTLSTYKKDGVDESKNSDVVSKKLDINNVSKTYGVTDNLEVNGNIGNVNIGLINASKFDLQLKKYVNKIIVQNSSGAKTYQYSNETLAKVELNSKKINNTNVLIEYKIVVTNNGDVPGYVKNIVDYIPSDVKFSSELNTDWYQNGSTIYNNSLTNEIINAGESKEITLIVTKSINGNNTGLISNSAEIAESYNEQGLKDINSTAGNKLKSEDDYGTADVLISIKTGETLFYIAIIIISIAVLGAGIYLIKIKVLKK